MVQGLGPRPAGLRAAGEHPSNILIVTDHWGKQRFRGLRFKV